MEKHPLDTWVSGFKRMVGQKPGVVNQRISGLWSLACTEYKEAKKKKKHNKKKHNKQKQVRSQIFRTGVAWISSLGILKAREVE